MKPFLFSFFLIFSSFVFSEESELRLSLGGRVNTIDPAMAADFASGYVVSAIYDTLLEYDYTVRPYRLKTSMLAAMPEVSTDMTVYKFRLREDLYFAETNFFAAKSKEERRVKAEDVVYSFLRIADARLNSPGYWLWRDKIKGIGEFRKRTSLAPKGDMSIYEEGCSGFFIVDDFTFEIRLVKADPRFLYLLAMPYTAVLSYGAGVFQKNDFSQESAGSGPYIIKEWSRDYKIVFLKNKDYRQEFFPAAENPEDRTVPLPFIDKITCYLVRQPLASWLMFLRGELDIGGIDADNFDAIVEPQTMDIAPVFKNMGIKLITTPEFQVNYVGFSFTDKILSGNLPLRKAISLAYNVRSRIVHSNYSLKAANGPIPPGIAGYNEEYVNFYSQFNLEEARRNLEEAGYPGGIDPKTGKPLELNFDLGDNTAHHRQLAELMRDDMAKIGIKILPVLNSKPRFFQKLSEGSMQLFRISWVGDYPDAENFLQLFYSPNAGKSNRVFYKDEKFDAIFEKISLMPDSPERTLLYSEMSEYLTSQCPWIFESYPVTYLLIHGWVENYISHNFANERWKYLTVNKEKKKGLLSKFKPVSLWKTRNTGTQNE